MADEVQTSTTEAVKKTSDGSVKIAVEKYNQMLETAAEQKSTIDRLNDTVNRLRAEPPVVHRTVVEKTPEMLAREQKAWGVSFMGLGVGSFAIGAFLYKAGRG